MSSPFEYAICKTLLCLLTSPLRSFFACPGVGLDCYLLSTVTTGPGHYTAEGRLERALEQKDTEGRDRGDKMGEKRRKDEDMKKGGEEPTVPASKGKGEERRRDGKQRNRVNNEGITEETQGGISLLPWQ